MTDARPTRTVRIDADVTIQTAADVKATVMALFDGESDVEIDLSGVTELDTAGLQILFLARREAENLGIDFRLTDPSDAVLDVLSTVGLGADLQPAAVDKATGEPLDDQRSVD